MVELSAFEKGWLAGLPKVQGVQAKDGIRIKCPYCGKSHTHSRETDGGIGGSFTDGRGPRKAHCDTPFFAQDYYIVGTTQKKEEIPKSRFCL